MFRAVFVIILSVALLNAPVVKAAGPVVEPGPDGQVEVTAEMGKFLSNAAVLGNMYKLVSRHGMSFDRMTRQALSTELSSYRIIFIRNQRPAPAFGEFTVKAGGGYTGIFTITGVSEVQIIEPAIQPNF